MTISEKKAIVEDKGYPSRDIDEIIKKARNRKKSRTGSSRY